MAAKTCTVEISEHLYQRLHQLAGTKLKGSKETYAKAMQSAAETAITKFLDGIERQDKEDSQV